MQIHIVTCTVDSSPTVIKPEYSSVDRRDRVSDLPLLVLIFSSKNGTELRASLWKRKRFTRTLRPVATISGRRAQAHYAVRRRAQRIMGRGVSLVQVGCLSRGWRAIISRER